MTDIFIEGGRTLLGDEILETSLRVAGRDIGAIGTGHGRGSLELNARDLLVLPGIVDLHGDAFERQMMPRPGVDFPIDVALADSDRQAIGNGITTVFHATTWSWEPGLRSGDNARELLEAIESLRPQRSTTCARFRGLAALRTMKSMWSLNANRSTRPSDSHCAMAGSASRL